jgi:hypothetical protein
MLFEPLRFRRRTRSNTCDFNDFLQALQSNETLQYVECYSQLELRIAEDEWVLLVKTLGSIKCIQNLSLDCAQISRDFHPFQAVAEAVNSAHSLRLLVLRLDDATFLRDSSGLAALVNALREHKTLEDFTWVDWCALLEGSQSTAFDSMLQELSACPHLRRAHIHTKCASADAIRNLLHVPTDTQLSLVLTSAQWLAVADEIRLGRCLIKKLSLNIFLCSSSEANEASKAVASGGSPFGIPWAKHKKGGFTDEAGVDLAEALTINKTLHAISLTDRLFSYPVYAKASLGAQAYEAFRAMLRVNTSIELDLPLFDDAVGDEREIEYFNQMLIEQRLNEVGRGRLLASSQTPREEWINALQELNAPNDDDLFKIGNAPNDDDLFKIACLYSLLRLNPSICMLEQNDTTNSDTSNTRVYLL